jgi:hypothetical protein
MPREELSMSELRQPRLFISYSRVDRHTTEQLVKHLRRSYDNVWYDESLHGGAIWWNEILNQIATCDIFLYLMSRDSVESNYCRAECKEAQRLHKQILPILIRARTPIPLEIQPIQIVDLSRGVTPETISDLQSALIRIERRISRPPLRPLSDEVSPMPVVTDAHQTPVPMPSQQMPRRWRPLSTWLAIAGLLAIGVIAGLLINSANTGSQGSPTLTTPTTYVALQPSVTPTLAATAQLPTSTPTRTPTSTFTQTYTALPTPNNTLSPTLSAIPLSDTAAVFQRLLVRAPELTQALGSPMVAQPINVPGSIQIFENGLMIWRGDSKDIYALSRQETFLTFRDTWTSRSNPLSCEAHPPRDFFQPAHGFGKVWCDNSELRNDLGFARTAEEQNYTFALQSFDNGWLIRIGDAVYALVTANSSDSGTWTQLNTYDYQVISLQQHSDSSSPEPNLGLSPGVKHLLGIPFEMGWKVTTQCRSPFQNRPTKVQLALSVIRPQKVHVLLQAGWGLTQYRNQAQGEVRLLFSDGSERRTQMILGFNIRDWARTRTNAVTIVTSPSLQSAWEGNAPDGIAGRMDILTIDIPDTYAAHTLKEIQIVDISDEIDPCIHLLGVTVRTSQ